MICIICKHGNTSPGHATVTLNRNDTIVIFKEVPADVCENRGEYYLSEAVAESVLKQAGEAAAKGAELEILRFAA